jgi:predicted nuclease with TOPRIM domain
MDDRLQEHRQRLAELAAEDRRKRAAAEPEIARKEAALAEARARLRRLNDDNALLEAELDGSEPAPANDDEPSETP